MNELSKPLKLGSLLALVVGNMIGTGVFLLPASLANLKASLLPWILTILGTFILALVLSRASQLVPRTGGPYTYAKQGFGNFIGFQTVYCHWIAMWVANAGLAVILVHYLAAIWPIFAIPIYSTVTALFFVWLALSINILGVRPMAKVQIVTTILKLIPILLIIILGWQHFHHEYILAKLETAANLNYLTISDEASLTLWAFIGVESATIPYDFIENPRRNIPLATLLGVLIAAIIYMLSSTVIMGMIPNAILVNAEFPFADALEMILGAWGKWVMFIGAAISCFACLNGWSFLQGQVAMAAADDGLFPKIFSLRNRAGVPVWGLLITAFLISAILLMTLNKNLIGQFHTIIIMASFAALIPYLYSSISLMIIVKQNKQKLFAANRLIFTSLSFLAFLFVFWAMYGIQEKMFFYGSLLLFTSIWLYAWDKE